MYLCIGKHYKKLKAFTKYAHTYQRKSEKMHCRASMNDKMDEIRNGS